MVCFLESKFQQQVMIAGDHQELSKGWQPNTLKMLSTNLQTSACPSLPAPALPLSLLFPRLPSFVCFEWQGTVFSQGNPLLPQLAHQEIV